MFIANLEELLAIGDRPDDLQTRVNEINNETEALAEKTRKLLVKKQKQNGILKRVYNKSPEELNREFTSFISLFKIDEGIEQRMEAKLMER